EFRRVLFRSPGRQNDSVAVGGCGRWARKECGYLAERFSQTSAGRLPIGRRVPTCPTSYATVSENVETSGAGASACQPWTRIKSWHAKAPAPPFDEPSRAADRFDLVAQA